MVTDIHLFHYISAAQCMILGADWISETQLTNKIGSLLLVEYAVTQNIPVYIAASTDKILSQSLYPLRVDIQSPGEIFETKSKYITVRNRYFEAVPLKEALHFITERGILRQPDIVKIAKMSAGNPVDHDNEVV